MNKDWLDIAVLEEYLDGKLDAKAMNRVEREALEDPFVAEALEGLSRAPRRSLDAMSLLQKQLHERVADQHRQKKRTVITWQRLSIAATAAVMFISVSVIFWMREDNRRKELAALPKKVDVNLAPKKESPAPVVAATKTPTEVKPEPLATDHTDVVIDRAIATSKTETYAALKKESRAMEEVSAQRERNPDEMVVSAAPVLKRQQRVTASAMMMPTAQTRFHGKVLAGDNGKPLPGVSIQIVGTGLKSTTDSNGDFEIRTDSLMNYGALKASSIGFKNIEMRAYPNEQFNLVLTPDSALLNEVVVVGYGAAKKNSKVSPALSGRVVGVVESGDKEVSLRGTNVLSDSFMPVGGWDQFRDYLKKKNRFRNEAKTGKSVVLSFNLDKVGQPEKIKVLMGITEQYDQEAIRLLSKGPKWNRPQAGGKQLFVNIEF